jgi:hypothetical protein
VAGTRNLDPLYKLSKNIKIAMLFLEDDDSVNAEVGGVAASSPPACATTFLLCLLCQVYIKKASALISTSKVSCHPCIHILAWP